MPEHGEKLVLLPIRGFRFRHAVLRRPEQNPRAAPRCASGPLMSRAIFDAPMTLPSASTIGDTVIEMSSSVPSLRRRTVS